MDISPNTFVVISEGNFRRLSSSDQHMMVKAAVAFFPSIEKQYGVNADARWEIVAEAKRLYWGHHSRADAPITASESNDWLRTLPPPPIYPAACGCPVCAGVQHG